MAGSQIKQLFWKKGLTYLKKHCIIITMSFPVEQKVGNHIYVYEAEGYWDK